MRIEIDQHEYSFTFLKEQLDNAGISYELNNNQLVLEVTPEGMDEFINYLVADNPKTILARLVICDLILKKIEDASALSEEVNTQEYQEYRDNFMAILTQALQSFEQLTAVHDDYAPVVLSRRPTDEQNIQHDIADFNKLLESIKNRMEDVAVQRAPLPSEEIINEPKKESDEEIISELKNYLGTMNTPRVEFQVNKGFLITHFKEKLSKVENPDLIFNLVEELKTQESYKHLRERKGTIKLSIHGHSDGTHDVSETFTVFLKIAKLRLARIAINKAHADDQTLLEKLKDTKTAEGKFINTKLEHSNLLFWKTSNTLKLLNTTQLNKAEEKLKKEERKYSITPPTL